MYVVSNKILKAEQFWVGGETWPEGVYSDEEATPAYFIDIDGVATSITDSDWVLVENNGGTYLSSMGNFIVEYTEVGE